MQLDDELWTAFFMETDEHLDALERLLAATPWRDPEIAAAFRAMHSLKGLSQAVGLPNMQYLTHHSEDILGMVRAGQVPLRSNLVAVLLAVTDRLRSMREWVQQHGTDAPEDASLAALLDRTVAELTPAGPSIVASPAVAPLADDGEMLMLYSELLEDLAPGLADLLGDDPVARQTGRDNAESLANGAEMLGLEQLAADLLALRHSGAQTLSALSEIATQLALIEEMTSAPSGAQRLVAALASAAALEAADRIKSLRNTMPPAADLSTALPAARTARIALEAAKRPLAAHKLLQMEEALANLPDTDAAAADLRARCVAVLDRLPLDDDLHDDAAAALDLVWSGETAPPRERAINLHLRPELAAVLTQAQSDTVEARLAAGWNAYTLLLDLDGSETAADLVAWLSSGTEVVTNCTVATGSGQSWFEFLLLSQTQAAELQAELAALDPDQACLHGLRLVGTAAGAPPETPASAATSVAMPPSGSTGASPVIRVRVDTIDRLMDEVSELRVALGALGEALRGGELAVNLAALRRTGQSPDLGVRSRGMERGHATLIDLQERLEDLHRQVWNRCMQLRVVPADSLFSRFPRLVRDLCQTLGKPADLEIHGREVRLDKSTADLLVDPLMHMLRNALDHGVEPVAARLAAGKPERSTLVLSAFEQGDGVSIAIGDDGAGLDRDRILARAIERGMTDPQTGRGLSDRAVFDFLFRAGFSTADAVTEISGRGVGLDVVAAVVQRLDGRIDIETEPGRGTKFVLSLPSSASLQNVLLVQAPQILALPERDVVTALTLGEALIDRIGRRTVLWHNDAPVPLVSLGGLLSLTDGSIPDPALAPNASIVVVSAGRELLALAVDAVPQRRELFIKELHPLLAQLPAVAGGAVLGDGRPVLVLDVTGLLTLAQTGALADG